MGCLPGRTYNFPMGRILVGTCNWSDFEHFYPRGLKPNERLGYYSRYFPLVEVDSTFYRLMPARNFELWAERSGRLDPARRSAVVRGREAVDV